MRTHYGPWQPCWISNQHQKQKSGRGPSNEHLWQVWLKSVQRFQRRRVKCEKLTDGRRTLTHDKSSHGLWPGELKKKEPSFNKFMYSVYGIHYLLSYHNGILMQFYFQSKIIKHSHIFFFLVSDLNRCLTLCCC